jgi:polyhydroxyalkanoate synthase
MGKDPPAFDILYWNADTTNMPAGLHRDFVGISLENALVQPGAVRVLGTPIDLRRSTWTPTSWPASPTTSRRGRTPTARRSSWARIRASCSPRAGTSPRWSTRPDNPKASYQLNTDNPPSPEDFLAGASTHRGTWWEDWASWLGERSGSERPAPGELGSDGHPPLEPAPGTYVKA